MQQPTADRRRRRIALPTRQRWEPWRDWAVIALANNGMLAAIAVLHLHGWRLALAALPLGLGFAVGTLTVLHDAGHRMYSPQQWPNVFAVQSSTPVGLWVGHWTLKHRVHHKFSQRYPIDEATRSSGMVRLHPAAPQRRVHRTQHLHALPLYGLAWAGELRSQLTYLRTGVVTGTTTPDGRSRAISFTVEKSLWLLALTPYAVVLGVLRLAVLMLLSMTVASMLAAIALVVGHINTGLQPDEPERWDWATNLFRTTASFAPDSVFLRFLTGGLTLHLAHHLRPVAVRSELLEINATTVETVAARVQLRPVVFPTLRGAVAGHFRRLRELGQSTRLAQIELPDQDRVVSSMPVPALVSSSARQPIAP